jgi:enoyl-CoA hydratase/carnithine racemase
VTTAEQRDTRVAWNAPWVEILIDRPDKMNALREQTAEEILTVLAEAEARDDIASAIIGTAGKAFCTGIDAAEFERATEAPFDFYRRRRRAWAIPRMMKSFAEYTKPVICAVEGFALGGGFELALACDLIVAAADAQFGFPEANLGMMPGGGGTQTLTRVVGKAIAKELVWTGRFVGADEAVALRFANARAPVGGSLAKAREFATAIGKKAPLPIMMSKAAIERGANMSLADGWAFEGDASYLLFFSQDRNEGLSAFREKRPPEFHGR